MLKHFGVGRLQSVAFCAGKQSSLIHNGLNSHIYEILIITSRGVSHVLSFQSSVSFQKSSFQCGESFSLFWEFGQFLFVVKGVAGLVVHTLAHSHHQAWSGLVNYSPNQMISFIDIWISVVIIYISQPSKQRNIAHTRQCAIKNIELYFHLTF